MGRSDYHGLRRRGKWKRDRRLSSSQASRSGGPAVPTVGIDGAMASQARRSPRSPVVGVSSPRPVRRPRRSLRRQRVILSQHRFEVPQRVDEAGEREAAGDRERDENDVGHVPISNPRAGAQRPHGREERSVDAVRPTTSQPDAKEGSGRARYGASQAPPRPSSDRPAAAAPMGQGRQRGHPCSQVPDRGAHGPRGPATARSFHLSASRAPGDVRVHATGRRSSPPSSAPRGRLARRGTDGTGTPRRAGADRAGAPAPDRRA